MTPVIWPVVDDSNDYQLLHVRFVPTMQSSLQGLSVEPVSFTFSKFYSSETEAPERLGNLPKVT